MRSLNSRYLKYTAIAACIALPLGAGAADTATDKNKDMANKPMQQGAKDMKAPATTTVVVPVIVATTAYSDRARLPAFTQQKETLQRALQIGQSKEYYRQALEKMGYKITAMNANDDDYLEYEIVKGRDTYEVQVDFDKGMRKSTKVDVTANAWQADATERALRDTNYRYDYPSAVTPNAALVSDRYRMRGYPAETEKLERALAMGKDKDFYRSELEKMGYQVTSVNDREADYIEYEVVKGRDTYEVQIDFDKSSRMASKIDVAPNVWKSDATERALAGR